MPSKTAFTARALAALLLAGSVMAAGSAPAQTNAGKNLRLVVPFPPGGSADVLARLVGQEAARIAKQSLVVENRPGGGTVIATEVVSRAAPDGATLLIMANSFTINATLRKSLPYDPKASFSPICQLVVSPQLLVVHSNSPWQTAGGFFAAVHAHPGEYSIATVGPATTQHIAAEQLKLAAKLDLTYVAYPGGAPAVQALLGEHVTSVLTNYSELVEHLKSGTLRPLAVASLRRMQAYPDLPTLAESGVPGYQATAWFGVMAPARTPLNVIADLETAFKGAMDVPAVTARLNEIGLYPAVVCGPEFTQHIDQQIDEYARVIKAAGIKGE
jgi:tripartite-type tricarboxylate transporter receptor subunit TctC